MLKVIPEDKLRRYIAFASLEKKTSILCDCGEVVECQIFPYAYDEENNDVYFASICPKCGELLITKE